MNQRQEIDHLSFPSADVHRSHRSESVWTLNRRAQTTKGSLGLVVAGVIAAGMAGYAVWTLNQSPSNTSTQQGNPGQGNDQPTDNGQSSSFGGGIAQTESIEEILGAVQVYVQEEQYEQALTVLEHAVAQYTNDQELRFALGDLYIQNDRPADAYTQFLAGIEIGPTTAIAEFTAGTLANMLDRPELAETHYTASMQLDASNPDTPLYLAAIQMKLNRLDEAKGSLALASRLSPNRARIFAMRSEIAMRENKTTIALDQIQKARQLEPDSLGWILQEARVLKRDRQPEQAVALLVALPEDELMRIETAMILADCYGMLGRPADAANRLMDIAQLHPNDSAVAFDVALWLDRAGEREQAVIWAKRADQLGHPRASDWIESLP